MRTLPGRFAALLSASIFALPANAGAAAAAGHAGPGACDVPAAGAWIQKWLDAWEMTSRQILKLPDAPAPEIVFYDSACVFTTAALTAGGRAPVEGPALRGRALPWRSFPHGGSMRLPDSSDVPIQLMSFTNVSKATGPFFVMAAPSYWAQQGHGSEPGLTGVFLHEFAHTRQVAGLAHVIGPIDSTWSFSEELNDDAVQHQFGKDSVYVAAYLAERDLLYRAANAGSIAEARGLATEALAMMRSRHARWFTGEFAVFATVDDVFLSMEGVGQWTAAAWLWHPQGGGLTRDEAIRTMLGRRRWWVQDEGLALLLVVDRLLPDWPRFAFATPAPGAVGLLARAVGE